MELILKTISPVHIGNGEELYALDYVIHNGIYYRITQNQFLKFLVSMNDDTLLAKYAGWINETEQQMIDIKFEKNKASREEKGDFNKQLSEVEERFNLKEFCKSCNLFPNFLKFLNENSKILKISNVQNIKHEIRSLINIQPNHYYFPATSIKGSVRTALLYYFLKNKADSNEIINLLKPKIDDLEKKQIPITQTYNKKLEWERDAKRKKKVTKEYKKDIVKLADDYTKKLDDDLQQLCFYCTEKGDIDEKFDLMKLLKISDGIIQEKNNVVGIGNVDLYVISQQIKEQFTEKEFIRKGSARQTQTSAVEYIKENISVGTTIDFNIDFILALKNQMRNNKIMIKKDNQETEVWISLTTKLKNVFNLDIETLNENNKEVKRQEVLHHILNCTYEFSKAQKNADNQWLRRFESQPLFPRDYSKTSTFKDDTEKLKIGLSMVSNHNSIRIGYGTGFQGTTEALYLLGAENLKTIFAKMVKLGLITNAGVYVDTAENFDITQFPKSRRFITQQNEILPLGWLSITEKGKPEIIIEEEKPKSIMEQAMETKPEYYSGRIKEKATGINAQVIKSGKPNKVKLFIAEDNEPEMDLIGYSSELKEGTIILVKINQYNQKKNQITQIAFEKLKT